MRKIFLAAILAFSICAFTACDAQKLSSLEDLSRPYAGVYECEQLRYGDEDKSGAFEYLRLTLENSGKFVLSYKTVKGAEGEIGGSYEADTERERITFHAGQGFRTVTRTFPMQGGAIRIDANLAGRLLYAEFKM